jgi:NAD(P)-dependent dehydrogenase (short-subunit alcohol dehydrogenase family)
MEDLAGRVAVVTGGASGIGRAMAARFSAEGMRVVVADVEPGPLESTATELGVTGVLTDVSEAASVQALADRVMDQLGRVDLLCNNAGVGGGGVVAELALTDWQWVLNVNLWGVVHGVHAFLPHLLSNPAGGHIVNTASMAGLAAFPGAAPYCASKYAVVGLSESLQQELQQAGAHVGVSVLCPGFVRTNIFTSQRNRPAELTVPGRGPRAGAREANDEIVKTMQELGIPPEAVAEDVLDAVRAGRFWIFTHPDLLPALDERHARLRTEGQPGRGTWLTSGPTPT